VDEDAAGALAALPGRTAVTAVSQDGTELVVDPFELDGSVLRAYAPRLKLAGVQRLSLRFAVEGRPWRADFELAEAEYHSFEQAIVVLRLEGIEPDGAGRETQRVAVHLPGTLQALFCQNAVDGNEYEIRIDGLSESGILLSTELRVEPRDRFAVIMVLDDRPMRVEAEAVKVVPGPYGRFSVGARLTRVTDGDALAIRRVAEASALGGDAE
jgi:hypothetical protein